MKYGIHEKTLNILYTCIYIYMMYNYFMYYLRNLSYQRRQNLHKQLRHRENSSYISIQCWMYYEIWKHKYLFFYC